MEIRRLFNDKYTDIETLLNKLGKSHNISKLIATLGVNGCIVYSNNNGDIGLGKVAHRLNQMAIRFMTEKEKELILL